jgi:FAD/FMN-containing dehydrogenase
VNLDGKIVWRGEPGFDEQVDAVVWNEMKPRRKPAVLVQPHTTEDVAQAVRLASQRGLQIKARSGGHSWTASSIRAGSMLIDPGRLNAIEIDAGSGTAIIGSGARGDDLQEALAAHNLFFPTGHCPSVGIGGFLLQGGWGWNSRAMGQGMSERS